MLEINHQKGGGSNYFGLGEIEFAMLATTQLQIRRISPLCGTSKVVGARDNFFYCQKRWLGGSVEQP